jgi:cytochrome c553
MNQFISLTIALLIAAAGSASAADAKTNWEQHCQKCHGADGKGQTPIGKKLMLKDFTDAKVQSALKDDEMLKVILSGVKDKDSGKTVMKGYSESLSAEENKALVPWIRAFGKK